MYYFSIDTVMDNEEVKFPTEFLNSQTPFGVPPHKIPLKVEVPIILLKNSPKLCNCTRLDRMTRVLCESVVVYYLGKLCVCVWEGG